MFMCLHICCVCCVLFIYFVLFFFFKQKTAYEMRISDWSSDVCSSDLAEQAKGHGCDSIVLEEPDFTQISRRGHGFHGPFPAASLVLKIGRASCRERVCQYV